MFEVIFLPPVADRNPEQGESWKCQDWQCPNWMSCARHHGRSYEYAAMVDPDQRTYSLLTPDRWGDYCDFYQRDRARSWLEGWCKPMMGKGECPGCGAPECEKAAPAVVSLPARHASVEE